MRSITASQSGVIAAATRLLSPGRSGEAQDVELLVVDAPEDDDTRARAGIEVRRRQIPGHRPGVPESNQRSSTLHVIAAGETVDRGGERSGDRGLRRRAEGGQAQTEDGQAETEQDLLMPRRAAVNVRLPGA